MVEVGGWRKLFRYVFRGGEVTGAGSSVLSVKGLVRAKRVERKIKLSFYASHFGLLCHCLVYD